MSAALGDLDRIVADAVPGATRGGRARRHEWSLHVPYRVAGRRLVAKVPLWEDAPTLEAALAAGPQSATRREAETLAALADSARSSTGLAAVDVVAYVEAANAIVMEWLDAVPLSKRLGSGRGKGDVGALMDRVGRAVRHLHEATGGTASGDFDPAPLLARLDALGRSTLPSRAAGAVESVREACASVADSATQVAVLHGDLSQANVLVTADDRVAIIDPNHVDGNPHADVAHLLADITARRDQLLTGGLLRPFPVVRAWAHSLMKGHGGLDTTLLECHLAVALLERWARVRQRSGPAGALGGALAGRVVESRVRSLVPPQRHPE